MKLIFYIFWRAFNSGKQKGDFLENILLLMSMELFVVSGFFLILMGNLFGVDIIRHIPNVRSENKIERLFAIALALLIPFLIFKGLKAYFLSGNTYKKIIQEYDLKYNKKRSMFFWFYLFVITISSFGSLFVIRLIN